MNRGVVIAGVCVVALVLAGAWMLYLRQYTLSPEQLATHEQRLRDDDPETRLAAARVILRAYPQRVDVALRAADAMLMLHRYREARLLLEPLAGPDSEPDLLIGLLDAYLAEIDDIVDRVRFDTIELAETQLEYLMPQAQSLVLRLNALDSHRATGHYYEARQLDAMIRLRKLSLDQHREEYRKAHAIASFFDRIQELGVAVTELETELAELRTRMDEMCQRAAREMPGDATRVRALQFAMWLRAGEVERARVVAAQVAQQPQRHREASAQIALSLIQLEDLMAVTPTHADIVLAAKLIEPFPHQPTETRTLAMVRYLLAMEAGDLDEALRIALMLSERRYPEALVMIADVHLRWGEHERVVHALLPHLEADPTTPVLLTLARAYLARGDVGRGLELVQQVIALEPRHLHARLLYSETLVEEGRILEAADQIEAALELSPRHPRVLRLQARLLIQTQRYDDLVRLLDRAMVRPNLKPEDVVLLLRVALDDVHGVKREVDQRLASAPDDPLALVALGWTLAPPTHRALIAAVITRSLVEHVDDDPFDRLDAGPVPILQWRSGMLLPVDVVREQGNTAYLRQPMFVGTPRHDAWQALRQAVVRWPDSKPLLEIGARLALHAADPGFALFCAQTLGDDASPLTRAIAAFLDGQLDHAARLLSQAHSQGDTSPTAMLLALELFISRQDESGALRQLDAMLAEHPWMHDAVMAMLAAMLHERDEQRMERIMAVVEAQNADLAHLSRARWALATGQPTLAAGHARIVYDQQPHGSQLRRWATDVLGAAYLHSDDYLMAYSIYDQMALGRPDQAWWITLANIDVALAGDKRDKAWERISAALATIDLPPRWTDQLLVRAQGAIEPARLASVLDSMIQVRPGNSVMRMHRAMLLAQAGDIRRAQQVLEHLLEHHPDSRRLLVMQAELFAHNGQVSLARERYRRLAQQGGWVARFAEDRLLALDTAAQASDIKPITTIATGSVAGE